MKSNEEILAKVLNVPVNSIEMHKSNFLIVDEALKAMDELVKSFTISDVVKSLPNDKEVKAHIDTLPYYGTCTIEYNEGFEDGVKWLKKQLAK